ncbi:type II secretion system F family protein [Pseudodesulfovibrio sp.]|uniref:type II secretion system F family protein n=1 Tax=Pseudodesulfovibrio sp. TaxID=2035812 RepID=UPI0026184E48|nr:type II secretion system F family protein [Pseudodesulfovibrio sp.]MDD3311548.1 type II secretion system F family protein [Pseudodesulfovibrio sp.]
MSLTLLIVVLGVVSAFLLASGVAALLTARREEAGERVGRRLRRLALHELESPSLDLLLAQSSMSQVPWFNRLLERARFASRLSLTIRQAAAKGTAGTFLLLSGVLGMAGFYGGLAFSGRWWVGALLAGVAGYLPFVWLNQKKRARMDAFHRQLPEVLDLMSRALKAGHTFGGAMRMVAEEFDDPVGGEFRKTLDEINYGLDVDRALNNLLTRVDVTDLKFFAVSVNIQRETGGNLAEIVENIARLVRERFVLFGKVRVLSAEGRLSAWLLSALPFVVTLILYLINPGYMSRMWTTELGQQMSYGAVIGMGFGMWCMRRMVNIKV